MYKYYELVLQGTDEVTLIYELESHRPAQVWADLISKKNPKDLRPSLNPWQNFYKDTVDEKIDALETLIDQLNSWLPHENQIKQKWDKNDNQSSVNRLHVHFPEQEKNETDLVRREQLTRYNDSIHELEGLTHRSEEKRPRLLLCTDGGDRVPLEKDDFELFDSSVKFGNLKLHYPHVGRHPFELYAAGDTTCPVDQILPQYEISPYHTLRFYDNQYLHHWHRGRFKSFYDRSTLKQKIAFNDPRMAFGYINLGNLVDHTCKNKLVEKISNCNTIKRWMVF